jgi:hypothetical protein
LLEEYTKNSKTAAANLEERIEELSVKLELLHSEKSPSAVEGTHLAEEEQAMDQKASLEQCLSICLRLIDHIRTFRPSAGLDSIEGIDESVKDSGLSVPRMTNDALDVCTQSLRNTAQHIQDISDEDRSKADMDEAEILEQLGGARNCLEFVRQSDKVSSGEERSTLPPYGTSQSHGQATHAYNGPVFHEPIDSHTVELVRALDCVPLAITQAAASNSVVTTWQTSFEQIQQQAQGKYEEAETLKQRVLEGREKDLGEGDPISLASGLLTLATFAFQSSITLYNTIKSFQNRPEHVRSLATELEALQGALHTLNDTLSTTTDIDIAALNLPLLRCGKACEELGEELEKCSSQLGSGRTSFRDWANFRYMGDGIDDFRQLLAGYKSTIIIALTDANL